MDRINRLVILLAQEFAPKRQSFPMNIYSEILMIFLVLSWPWLKKETVNSQSGEDRFEE